MQWRVLSDAQWLKIILAMLVLWLLVGCDREVKGTPHPVPTQANIKPVPAPVATATLKATCTLGQEITYPGCDY